MMEITKKQRKEMEHALGLNYQKTPYRNKFCTYSPDKSWEDLMDKGIANVSITHSGERTYYFYYVTKKGIEFLGFKCECAELGCQNKFYKNVRITPLQKLRYCRKHYNQYR